MPTDPLKAILEKLENLESGGSKKETQIKHVQEKLDQASVLNGGFDKVMLKLDYIQEKQEETSGQVNMLVEKLFDPDKGFFSRVREMENTTESLAEKLSEHIGQDKEILATFKEVAEKVEEHDDTTKQLKIISGEDYNDLRSAVKISKAFNKLFWLVASGVGAMISKIIWDIYQNTHIVHQIPTALGH